MLPVSTSRVQLAEVTGCGVKFSEWGGTFGQRVDSSLDYTQPLTRKFQDNLDGTQRILGAAGLGQNLVLGRTRGSIGGQWGSLSPRRNAKSVGVGPTAPI
jgi:hypothetical protein